MVSNSDDNIHIQFIFLIFFCHPLKLVIEVDGRIHDKEDVKLNDQTRENLLKNDGLIILGFKNEEIINSPENVIHKIEKSIKTLSDQLQNL